jgi:hypothetical protein
MSTKHNKYVVNKKALNDFDDTTCIGFRERFG